MTADEVMRQNETYIIQESKNATGAFPSRADIKDGLFKLILFSNLSELKIDGQLVTFATRLKLTGSRVSGSVLLPCEPEKIEKFLLQNRNVYRAGEATMIRKLNEEARRNAPLMIAIGGNALAVAN